MIAASGHGDWMSQQSLVKQGARLAMSADASTAPLDPWLQIEVAMLHKEPDQTEAFMPVSWAPDLASLWETHCSQSG